MNNITLILYHRIAHQLSEGKIYRVQSDLFNPPPLVPATFWPDYKIAGLAKNDFRHGETPPPPYTSPL